MNYDEILKKLEAMGDPSVTKSDERFGIITKSRKIGISNPDTRKLAKETGKDHHLAQQLWKSDIHEAMRLAAFIDNPAEVTEKQMEDWVKDIDNWGTCDTVCGSLFDKTPFAYRKAVEWTKRKEEFVKRAGFVLMACLAVHDKAADDRKFLPFLKIIKRESLDDRNFVRKAVNWALRQIGKRNRRLNKAAIKTAEQIARIDSKSARWIAADALRELRSSAVQRRMN